MFKKFLTLFFSIIFSLIIVELFLKFFLPQDLTAPFRVYGKNGLILNIKNSDAKHSLRGEKMADYKFGDFHNRIYDIQNKNRKILVLGDSYTFGWLIEDENTYIYKLNKKFKDFYFINASAGGWGASDQLRYLIDFCDIIKPEYTLIFMNAGDLIRARRSNLFYLDINEDLIAGENKKIQLKEILKGNFFYRFLTENFHTINFLRQIIAEKTVNNPIIQKNVNKQNIQNLKKNEKKLNDKETLLKDDYKLIKKIYLKIKEEANKCNTSLILINLGWYNYNNEKINENIHYSLNKFIKNNKNFFKKNFFTFVDLNNEMNEIHTNTEKYTLKYDKHPNILGNDYIYKKVYANLKNLIK